MELKHVDNPIDTAGPLRQVVTNLFYGWGYNFYRKENQARADDLLIRNKVSELLGKARGHLARLEAEYRRDHLPAPTREQPLPDPTAVANAKALARAQQDLESLEVSIRSAPVPEMDRQSQRHRDELETLNGLRDIDLQLAGEVVGLAEAVQSLTDGATAAGDVVKLIAATRLREICALRRAQLSLLTA